MRRWLTIAALLVATVFSQGQTTALRTILSGDNPILFSYSAGDSLAAATFSRASTATYRDVAGVLQTASTGVARDSHYALDPVSGLYKRSLLLEGQRTNLHLRSEELDNAGWSKSEATVSANATAAPSGATTADKLIDSTNVADHLYEQGVAKAASALPYAFSVFLKQGELTVARILIVDPSAAIGVTMTVDLAAGTITSAAALGAAGWSAAVGEIEGPINGFYRVWVGVTTDAVGETIYARVITKAAAYAGNGTDGLFVFGNQFEQAAFPSSYIPTTTATVTRAADSLSFPFTAVPQEMTVFVRGVDQGTSSIANARLFQIGTNAVPWILGYGTGSTYSFYHQNGASQTSESSPAGTIGVGDTFETRLVLESNGSTIAGTSKNGAAETTNDNGNTAALDAAWSATTLYLNSSIAGHQGFNAYRDFITVRGIKDLSYFRSRIAP